MEIMLMTSFDKSLGELNRKGGNYQRAVAQIHEMLGKYSTGADNPFESLKFTRYGESRIDKCLKYDLSKFCRLVTVRDGGYVFLAFCGTHKDCDKWLETNRGLKIKAGRDMRPIQTYESIDIESAETRLNGMSTAFHDQLLAKLPKKLSSKLLKRVPPLFVDHLDGLSSLTEDEKIFDLVMQIQTDDEHRVAIYDVMVLLKKGKLQQAENRVHAFLGDLQQISDSAVLKNSEFLHTIPLDSDHYRTLIESFSKKANYKDWMLFMHPDQEHFVNADYPGAVKISGVSGSGKTCVVVKRAIRLAKMYPEGKILVLTLNRPLSGLINALVKTAAASTAIRQRIEVRPFFDLCQELLFEFEPGNRKLYNDETLPGRYSTNKDHIDEVWAEYYRCELNNYDARVMQNVHDSLIARGIDAESYIREEFDWIRSAVSRTNRSAYLQLQRTGRTHPFDGTFRRPLLDGLKSWETKMRQIGATDYLGLSTALYAHINKIRPRYRSILVDESQDFGTIELEIIGELVEHQENSSFFCGDAAQRVSCKHQDFKDAKISIPVGKANKLLRNYRNGRDILRAAHSVLVKNLSDELMNNKEFEVLDPSLSYFPGNPPLLLSAKSLSQEIAAAKHHLEQELEASPSQKACMVFCGYSLFELQKFGKKLKIPVLYGTRKRALDDASIFISDLENSKGFEFQHVCILNCSSSVIPNPESPEKEQFRDLARLYVAMTRAVTQLVLSYTGKPSDFLLPAKAGFLEDGWPEYLGLQPSELESIPAPKKLDEVRTVDNQNPFAEMTGEQFLYTKHALGLDLNLIKKIRKLITGKRATQNGQTVAWRNFSDAATDIKVHPSARQQFGADLDSFKELLSKHLKK